MTPHEFVRRLIPHRNAPQVQHGQAWAPVNIALAKYWGKRDTALNLPQNSSLSISLPQLGTDTRVTLIEGADRITLNGQPAPQAFAQRLSRFLDLFRPEGMGFAVETHNSVPTAAGLASSASGFAALVKALDQLFGWRLSAQKLSMLARLGSGSASRSLFNGFALWHRGQQTDGLDSYAEPIDIQWPDLRIGLLEIDTGTKPISSTAGMQQTVATCPLYRAWPEFAEASVQAQLAAITARDLPQLGDLAEHNALTMHATMIATHPSVLYWTADSVSAMQQIWALRQQGVGVWFTMDAGPNLKLLFEKTDQRTVEAALPNLETLVPFG